MKEAGPGGPLWATDALTRVSRRSLAWTASVVPAGRRAEWLEEWEAELWQLRRGGSAGRLPAFLAGALWDAVNEWNEGWTMESVWQDTRLALRSLRRSPGFTATALVLLATSIGATTALFSVLEKAVWGDPPYPEADRLVVVDQMFGETRESMGPSQWSYPRYLALGNEVGSLDAVAGFALRTMTLTELGDPVVVSVETITPSLLSLLGVDAVRGRAFGPDEEDAGAPNLVAMVSHAFWSARMGATPSAVGSTLTLDQIRLEVLGVLPDGFEGVTGAAEIWVPMSALRELEEPSALEDPWNMHFNVLARMAEDVSLDGLRAELEGLAPTLVDRFPAPVAASRLAYTVDAVPLREARSNPTARRSMTALFGAVLLVVLVAAANLAGLLLARSSTRRAEAALRASLGADRGRLVRQFLTESLVLAGLGGLAGLAVAGLGVGALGGWLTDALGSTGGRGLEFLDAEGLTIDWRVTLFATLLTTGVGVACGLMPAWQASRVDPNTSLRGGRSGEGARGPALGLLGRNGLVMVQIAVAIVLLTGATVMIRSMAALQERDLGYEREALFTAMYSLTPNDELAGIEPGVFHVDFLNRVRALPGVRGATLGEVPQGGPTWRTIVMSSEGRPELEPASHTWIRVQPVPEGHFEVMGMPILEGRGVEATDDADSEPVVVLNEMAARELFPEGNAIGQRVELGWQELGGAGARVVGITRAVQLGPLDAPPERQAWVSIRQAPRLQTGVLIRTDRAVAEVASSVRSALAELGPNTALTSVMSMEERVADVTARARVITLLLGLFSGLTVVLVAAGLYGTIAYVVSGRTRELGLRLSLGADRWSVLELVLRQGVSITLGGLALGGIGTLWAVRFLDGLTVGVDTSTWSSLVPVSVVLLVVALLAAYLPARRALRIDPMAALRSD